MSSNARNAILRVKLKHTVGFMSLIAVYPTEMCESEEVLYAKLDSILD